MGSRLTVELIFSSKKSKQLLKEWFIMQKVVKKKKKKLYGPFTFYHSVPRNSWYSFYRPRKDERLSRPWSHPVVLNTGPLDWESSALTTRPLVSIAPLFLVVLHHSSFYISRYHFLQLFRT